MVKSSPALEPTSGERHFLTATPRAHAGSSQRTLPRLKRLIDLVVAGGALILLAPVFVVIAALIYLEDRGPLIYRQERVGRGGRTFGFFKFRSMVVNADALKAQLSAQNEATGPIFKMKNDPRVTRTGRILRRYSLDELPQLWNVLIGDMSLVGPRPHLPKEIAACPSYPQERLSVSPGLLCLREVLGRSELTFEEWLALDLDYVRRQSLRLDLWILARAIPAVLRGEGAY